MSESKPDIRVILNIGSGKRRGEELVKELKTEFDRYPGRFDLERIEPGMDVAAEAKKAVDEGFATVVACGGDGTISGVAQGVAGSEARLGVLSFGTFNYFARSLGLPESTEDKVRLLVEGEPRQINIGSVNGQVFLNNASLGAYARILEQREAIYNKYGRSRVAAFYSVFVTLAETRKPMKLGLVVDGEKRPVKTSLAFVAANPYQLEQFGLDGGECIRNGQFALFLAPAGSPLSLIVFALRLGAKHLKAGRDYELVCGREIVIETRKRRRLVAYDGERSHMDAPFKFEMRENGLTVLVPKSAGEDPSGSSEKVS